MAELPNVVTGIFVGPDPVADRVIAVGDAINGVRVESLDFFRGLTIADR